MWGNLVGFHGNGEERQTGKRILQHYLKDWESDDGLKKENRK